MKIDEIPNFGFGVGTKLLKKYSADNVVVEKRTACT